MDFVETPKRLVVLLPLGKKFVEADAEARKVTVTSTGQGGTDLMLPYDVLHAVPRQSAPCSQWR